ncbi:AraC family transcriptional regulator [candidate division KSB1 bacterium]|nr:AraC family transcriptional regulator [candidate division KSB1 bacterium]
MIAANSPESFQQAAASNAIHGVVLHFQILTPAQISLIEKLNAFTAWLPTVILADQWDLEAVRQCGEIGIDAFVACTEKPEKKIAIIASALLAGGFRKLLADIEMPPPTWPARMKNAYQIILANFPKMLNVGELSSSLGVHRRFFEKEFRKTFGLSCLCFMRVLRMYESWHLMQYTGLDNTEIADYLHYHQEAHFARDCRKVFGFNPKQLRALPEKEFRNLIKKCFLQEK